MMVENFFTIKEDECSSELVEKKSKFIATFTKIESEEEALKKLSEVKKKYKDAKHHVFAYRLSNGLERFSDDGEPSGTAGVPILDILRGEKLENVLVVVTRYFGGILLGTGGLLRAYSQTAKEAILKASKVEMVLCNELDVSIDYSYNDILQHYFRTGSVIVKETMFLDRIHLYIIVEKSKADDVSGKILEKTDRTAIIKQNETYYYPKM